MKTLFFFSVLHKLFDLVAKELRKENRGHQFSGLVYGVDQVDYLRASGFPSAELYAFTAYLKDNFHRYEPNPKFLAEWEQRHDALLSIMISADRLFTHFSREKMLRLARLSIEWLETILAQTRPDVIVAEGIDCLLSYLLYTLAKARGIPFFITYATPMPGRIAIYSNPHNHWEKVERTFTDLKPGCLTPEQRSKAEAVVQEYVKKRLVPNYIAKGRVTKVLNGFRDITTLMHVARRNWRDPMHSYNPSYAGGVGEVILRKIKRIVTSSVSGKVYFDRPREEEPYVFYPLQVHPECSTTVFAPFYENQLYVIQCLAKSLPIDHVLYVKEHPAMLGRRPLSYYQEILSIPNTRLIDPRVHSHSLIQKASAVAVVSSTVGWEALIYERPVITFGHVFYDSFDLVQRVGSMNDLPIVIKNAIENFRPDRELLLKYVTAVLEGTYEGEIDNPDNNPAVLSNQNVCALAQAIMRHIRYANEANRNIDPVGVDVGI